MSSNTPEHLRQPCPDRILDDIGGAFGMGAVGGSIWYLFRGLSMSPTGYKFRGALDMIRKEAPRTGGSFAVWGGLFSTSDCFLVWLRQKEDPWNSIMAGAFTGGFLQLRTGLNSAAKSAFVGGMILAMIEGLGIIMTRMTSPPPPSMPIPPSMAMDTPASQGSQFSLGGSLSEGRSGDETSGTSESQGLFSWFSGGGGGGGGKESNSPSSSSEEILRS